MIWRFKSMAKTPDYTKNAIDTYRKKFDMLQIRFPKETKLKDRIKEAYGKDLNAKIIELLEKDLEQRENPQETPTPAAVFDEMFKAIDNELKLAGYDNIKLPIETKARIYKNITGVDMPDWMRHEQKKIKVVQPEKSPDSVIFDGLEVSPERAKEIQEKLDQQLKVKEEQEKQTPKRDSFIDTLERLRKDNQDGKLALNVREDI